MRAGPLLRRTFRKVGHPASSWHVNLFVQSLPEPHLESLTKILTVRKNRSLLQARICKAPREIANFMGVGVVGRRFGETNFVFSAKQGVNCDEENYL